MVKEDYLNKLGLDILIHEVQKCRTRWCILFWIGGFDVSPPISWIFEPNFLLSFPSESVHIMRYKDVNDRMETLYPFFLYDLFGRELDSLPVTDGTNSYWLIPLIIGFDTGDVPWSVGNPLPSISWICTSRFV